MSKRPVNEIKIEGIVQYFGNEPKSFLGIKSGNKVYKISNTQSIKKFQGEKIKVEAILLKKALGPGFPAIIKVLSVKK